MKIYFYRTCFDEEYKEVLIVELEKLKAEEKKLLDGNNILCRYNKDKVELVILSFANYLVEYDYVGKEGIYFEKTEEYYNYYDEIYHVEEMGDEYAKNLVICKGKMKIEILIYSDENSIKDDRKIFEEYFG